MGTNGAEAADTVYQNGRIYTVNSSMPWVQAVAIKDSRFVFVGEDRDVAPHIGPETHVVDLKGRMALPGLHDAHQHLLKAQMRDINCNIPPNSGLEEIIAVLQGCAQGKDSNEWIVADVYRPDLFPDGKAHRRYIDAAFPNTPVFIREWSYHHGLANSKALQIAGVDHDTLDPAGGKVLRDDDGEPTGELLSKATWLVIKAIPSLPPVTVRDAVLRSSKLCSQFGITSAQEATATADMLTEIKKLDEEGEWPLRLAAHLVWDNPGSVGVSLSGMNNAIKNRATYRTPHVATDFVKIYIDGSPLQPHATDVPVDETGHIAVERLYLTPDTLNKALTRFDKMGIKVKMHAVGTGATRIAIDAIEAARKANGNSHVLHDVAHSVHFTPVDIKRLAQVGAVAELSPAIWQIKGPLTANLGGAWQFKTLLHHDTLLTVGSDWVILPLPNLFPGLAGMLDHGAESIDLKSSIEALTLNGAKSVGWENISGSIEVGKFADMIVLDRNLFDITPAEIAETRVLTTIFEGRVVYQAEYQ